MLGRRESHPHARPAIEDRIDLETIDLPIVADLLAAAAGIGVGLWLGHLVVPLILRAIGA